MGISSRVRLVGKDLGSMTYSGLLYGGQFTQQTAGAFYIQRLRVWCLMWALIQWTGKGIVHYKSIVATLR